MRRVRITSRNRPLFRRRVAVDLVRFTDAIAATQRNGRFGLTRSHEDIGDSKEEYGLCSGRVVESCCWVAA